MLKLFQKKSKVKQGKQTQADASAQNKQEKKQAPLAAFGKTWKKLNSMDRKQAYTWGAVVLVGVVGLLILASAASGDQDDFSDFETRGYDLANMPFSSDEAEQYLLASKYPDMEEGNKGMGLYSEEEKEERQEEDAAQAELDTSASSTASEYVGGRYYGGGSGRVGPRTKVGSLNSASVKGASGSGLNSKFGPQGDFSNFRSQNRGNDKAPGRGTGNARKALQQTARASRAAAGLKNDKMLNAKKALMGGSVDGSKAFMDDSGAVNLGEAAGLELDTNAPVSSADLSGLDQGLNDAKDKGQKDAKDKEDEDDLKWLKDLAVDLVKKAVTYGFDLAKQETSKAIALQHQKEANWQFELQNNPELMASKPVDVAPGTSFSGSDLLQHATNGDFGLSYDKGTGVISSNGKPIGSAHTMTLPTPTGGTEQRTVTIMNGGGNAYTPSPSQVKSYNSAQTKAWENSPQYKQSKALSDARTKQQFYGGTSAGDYIVNSPSESRGGDYIDVGGKRVYGTMSGDGKTFVADQQSGRKTYRNNATSGSSPNWAEEKTTTMGN